MDIHCGRLRDRRIAASDETISVAGARIYGRGSVAESRGSQRARITDRSPQVINTIILHQTAGRSFLPKTRAAYPLDASFDKSVRHDHAIDRVAAHFVVLNDGMMFYTHDVEFIINSEVGKKLKAWCNQGVSMDTIKSEINSTTTLEGLRHLYQKYGALNEQIKPLIIDRKTEIENTAQIVENKHIIQTKNI